MKYTYDKNILTIDDTKISFPYEIDSFLEWKDGLVVLLYTNTKKCRDNIFFVNENGTIRWQIEPFAYVEKPGYTGYTSIFERNGELHANMFDGYDCVIDPINGKIISRIFSMF